MPFQNIEIKDNNDFAEDSPSGYLVIFQVVHSMGNLSTNIGASGLYVVRIFAPGLPLGFTCRLCSNMQGL